VSTRILYSKYNTDKQFSTSICSGIKTSYLSELANRTDFTWATYDIFAWVTAEFFLVVVCGSIPTMKPVLDLIRRRLGIKSKGSENSYERHTGDSEFRNDDAIALNGFRKDAVKSKAVISNSKAFGSTGRDGSEDSLAPGQDILIERTYRVQINR
jgi:hypothetical protein